METYTREIGSFLYACCRHGGDGLGHDMPWQQGHDVFASDRRILVRVPAVDCVGLKVDSDFRLEGVERFFEDWWPADLPWKLPWGVTGGIRPVKVGVGGVFVMARYVGLLRGYGVREVIPDVRVGGPLGFIAGSLEGLLMPMEVEKDRPKFRRRGGPS